MVPVSMMSEAKLKPGHIIQCQHGASQDMSKHMALHTLSQPHTLHPKLLMGCMLRHSLCDNTNCVLCRALTGSPGVALAQQPGPQQATVAAIQACPAGKQGKLVSGLKRGFLSGTKSKNTTMKQANTSANPVHATGSTNGSKASPSSKFAVSMDHIVFTGSIVEHQDPQATDLQGGHNAGRLSGNDSRTSMSGRADIAAGSMAACTAPERLSKFKQARSAVSTHR